MARIAVIEDNPANLDLMLYVLHAYGHEIVSAVDGDAGLALVQREHPDLIVCDIHLPKLDGYQIAQRLKADPDFQGTPLIAVTALAMVGDRERGFAAGFDGYIYKPIDPETFVTEVEQFLYRSRRGETLFSKTVTALNGEESVHEVRASILFVDDEPVNQELMLGLLQPFGYEVRVASNVPDAMSSIHRTMPDMVVADLHMPGEDGFELIRQIKVNPCIAHIPILILSSTAWGEQDRTTAMRLGADDFLARPIEPDVLMGGIKKCLERNKGVPHGESHTHR